MSESTIESTLEGAAGCCQGHSPLEARVRELQDPGLHALKTAAPSTSITTKEVTLA